MFFSEEKSKKEGIELTWINVEQVIINYVGQKSDFEASSLMNNINSTTISFEDQDLWITYYNSKA